MNLIILKIDHRFGTDVYAAKTEGRLRDKLFEFVKSWWTEIFPEDINGPSEEMSRDEAIYTYFENHPSEEYELLDVVELLE